MTRLEWLVRFYGPERLVKCAKFTPGPDALVGRKKWPGLPVQHPFRIRWTGTCGWAAQPRAHLPLVTMTTGRLLPSVRRRAKVSAVMVITGFTCRKTGADFLILAAA